MALPSTATFEPLEPDATNVLLSVAAQRTMSTHTTYELPCELENEGTPQGQVQQFDSVHRFTLQRRVSKPLNERLIKLAARKEQLAQECEMRLVHIPPGPQSDAGVVKTNRGGYQSYHDLFEDNAPRACNDLRELVSVALTEIVGLEHKTTGECTSYEGDDACLMPAPGGLHGAYAWFNVNRGTNSNAVHQHDIDRWSAVYFVSDCEPNAPGSPCPESSHMLFRCGPKAMPSPFDGTASLSPCSHSYMSVAPLPGSLWIFPGSIPHAVVRRAACAYTPGRALTPPSAPGKPGPAHAAVSSKLSGARARECMAAQRNSALTRGVDCVMCHRLCADADSSTPWSGGTGATKDQHRHQLCGRKVSASPQHYLLGGNVNHTAACRRSCIAGTTSESLVKGSSEWILTLVL